MRPTPRGRGGGAKCHVQVLVGPRAAPGPAPSAPRQKGEAEGRGEQVRGDSPARNQTFGGPAGPGTPGLKTPSAAARCPTAPCSTESHCVTRVPKHTRNQPPPGGSDTALRGAPPSPAASPLLQPLPCQYGRCAGEPTTHTRGLDVIPDQQGPPSPPWSAGISNHNVTQPRPSRAGLGLGRGRDGQQVRHHRCRQTPRGSRGGTRAQAGSGGHPSKLPGQ